MDSNQPTIKLPKSVDDALEALMLRDREWFDTHPDRRVRRRLVEGCELRSSALAAIAAGDTPAPDSLEVLVVRTPSTSGVRIRLFLPIDPAGHAWYVRHAKELSGAVTDDDFISLLVRRILPFGRARRSNDLAG